MIIAEFWWENSSQYNFMQLNFWTKLLRVYQRHHKTETQRLGGKKSREYSFCSSPPVYRWVLSTLQRQSSCLFFWLLHNILRSHSSYILYFYIIEYYQRFRSIKLTKFLLQNNKKRSYFIPKTSNAPEPRKKWRVLVSFKIIIYGKNLTHCTADKFTFP